jgi:hypothetical protein
MTYPGRFDFGIDKIAQFGFERIVVCCSYCEIYDVAAAEKLDIEALGVYLVLDDTTDSSGNAYRLAIETA